LGSTAGSAVEALDAQVVDDLGAATELIANAAAVDLLYFETSFE
jgi:hypothetical protein